MMDDAIVYTDANSFPGRVKAHGSTSVVIVFEFHFSHFFHFAYNKFIFFFLDVFNNIFVLIKILLHNILIWNVVFFCFFFLFIYSRVDGRTDDDAAVQTGESQCWITYENVLNIIHRHITSSPTKRVNPAWYKIHRTWDKKKKIKWK